ncbi:MAG TPA: beta-ketoacyl-ACP synthase [Leptolyngbyaceae cyanobacterium M65_K2018_010]|nr:beta-ketoacyl-ACP synthase [Leptolyngbyaceae cyanobacterium M65_K2018_010]
MGLVSALGASLAATWPRLLAGKSGLSRRQPFADLPPLPIGMVGQYPAQLGDLLRPAVAAALADAGLSPPLPNCGVVIGSSRSFQGIWEQQSKAWLTQGTPPEGRSWLTALPPAATLAIARQIGAIGPLLAPMAACATGLWAIFQGYELIRRGQCDQVLVGAVEAPITPLTLAGFQQIGALASNGCYPFALDREGLALGEGAAVLVLESGAALARRAGAQPYGRILGGGFSADAYHMTAPDPQQTGSRLALEACLRHSGLRPEQVDYVHAHGTGTRLNDAQEAALITQCLPHQPAASSTKGATGHTLGAAGAMGAVFGLMALRYGQLPPNVGLRGRPIYPALVQETRSETVKTVLCLSFGFGGQNGVLALGHA